jgi:hypothetical protein
MRRGLCSKAMPDPSGMDPLEVQQFEGLAEREGFEPSIQVLACITV